MISINSNNLKITLNFFWRGGGVESFFLSFLNKAHRILTCTSSVEYRLVHLDTVKQKVIPSRIDDEDKTTLFSMKSLSYLRE